MAGFCFDIDGNWWNGHGPGSRCRHCDPQPLKEGTLELIDGKKSPTRREQAEEGVLEFGPNGRSFKPYRKTSITYAVQVDTEFAVNTLEGVHTGKPGDFLAVGLHGEMYPIDGQVFVDSYEPATAMDEEKHG